MRYSYKCKSCEHSFNRDLPMKDYQLPNSEPCPKCGVVGEVERYYGVVDGETEISGAPALFGMKGHGGLERKYKNLDGDWKDIVKSIKKGNPGSTIKDY